MRKLEKDGLKLKGRRVVILGLARQGTALARFLVEEGASVIVSDLRKEADLADEMASLEGLPIEYVLGRHPKRILEGADLLCLSGGVPLDAPIVVEAQKRRIPLSNDAQIFIERCPAPVIGITGSAGKTTTTALVGEMCKAAGFTTWVGGNIGNPLIMDLKKIQPEDKVVMELSSFQLEIMNTSPHIAAILNVTPNHLDRHETMENYIAAKQNIINHQTAKDYAVLGFDDARARGLALETAAQLVFFSAVAEIETGAWKTNGEMNLRFEGVDTLICKSDEVQLRGHHNILNILAASAISTVAGVPVEAIRETARSFTGVEHRLELVREVRGVRYYDDSIATAPERVVAALRSYEEPIVLLAGGRDKDLPWEPFAAEAVARARHVVTFGEAGPMIARVIEARQAQADGKLEGITPVNTLEEAVAAAAEIANPGDVVLLSPGGTSFDAFRDFAERGDRFKAMVEALEE